MLWGSLTMRKVFWLPFHAILLLTLDGIIAELIQSSKAV
jgi:hypothetical protein